MKSELKAANQQQALGIAILLLVLIISPIIIFLVRNATATIHIFSLTLTNKEQELVQVINNAESINKTTETAGEAEDGEPALPHPPLHNRSGHPDEEGSGC